MRTAQSKVSRLERPRRIGEKNAQRVRAPPAKRFLVRRDFTLALLRSDFAAGLPSCTRKLKCMLRSIVLVTVPCYETSKAPKGALISWDGCHVTAPGL